MASDRPALAREARALHAVGSESAAASTERLREHDREHAAVEAALDHRADSFAGNYVVALPPTSERPQIAKFLGHETSKIDVLIDKQEELVDLLQERRTALISAAVTGKIDVRNWLPDPDATEMEVA